MKVLIVDDQEEVRSSFRKDRAILEEANLELLEATNGKEAYKIYSENKEISHMVVDIHMPIMNGRILIEKLRTEYPERMENTKVFLMCTDNNLNEISSDGVTTTSQYRLFKPINAKSFFKFVKTDIVKKKSSKTIDHTLTDLFIKVRELSPSEKDEVKSLLESFLQQSS
ncbi:MAG: response regulator [Myxococcota bacterium]|nr:response regulator [Myxococcota bacterium]